jgi:glutathione S-transferase
MIKLYDHPLSGHAHRARAMLKLLGLEYESVVVDLANNAHKSPEFLALNAFGQVPVLVDGDVVIRDSAAILTYLASKYDTSGYWLPKDPALAAEVAAWLTTSTKEIYDGPFKARLVKVFNQPLDHAAAVEASHRVLGSVFDPHLANRDWLVGDSPTIADIANYGYISCAPEGDVDLTDYPSVIIWLRRLERIPNFETMPAVADVLAA